MDIFKQLLNEREAELIEIRRYLHSYPELAGYEKNTPAFIRDKLKTEGIDFIEVEKGGILAEISGGTSEKCVLLRADMDALPINEDGFNLVQEKQTVSKIPGAAHLCGHDGHTAMLLICGAILKKLSFRLDGKVLLCFERAEEGGGPDHAYGVYPLLKYMEDNKIRIDKCFALHVNPELESGKISAEAGGVMAGSFGFEIHIRGKGGHGSRPDLANNPLDCFCDFYQALSKAAMRNIDPYKLITFSIPLVQMGKYNNVISDELYFSGTARSLDTESLEAFRDVFVKQLDHITAAYDCTYSTDSFYIETPLRNDAECSQRIKETVEQYFGKEQYLSCKANLGSESFAHYIDKYSGVLAFLGIKNIKAGSGSPLHSPCFDLDENALKYGAGILAGFALDELSRKNK